MFFVIDSRVLVMIATMLKQVKEVIGEVVKQSVFPISVLHITTTIYAAMNYSRIRQLLSKQR